MIEKRGETIDLRIPLSGKSASILRNLIDQGYAITYREAVVIALYSIQFLIYHNEEIVLLINTKKFEEGLKV